MGREATSRRSQAYAVATAWAGVATVATVAPMFGSPGMLLVPLAVIPILWVRRRLPSTLVYLIVAALSVSLLGVLNAVLQPGVTGSTSFWLALGTTAAVAVLAPSPSSRAEEHDLRLISCGPSGSEPAESVRYLFIAQEEEQRRIAYELHDDLGQLLTALKYHVENVEETWHQNKPLAEESLTAIRNIVDEGFDNLHRIVYNLRPQILDNLGLVPAIQWYARDFLERSGLKVQLDLAVPVRMGSEKETALFRIAQEACTNIVRHAEATAVSITLRCYEKSGVVQLDISDNGRGFKPGDGGADDLRLGLRGMCERARSIGGRCAIASGPDAGTRIAVTVPL